MIALRLDGAGIGVISESSVDRNAVHLLEMDHPRVHLSIVKKTDRRKRIGPIAAYRLVGAIDQVTANSWLSKCPLIPQGALQKR